APGRALLLRGPDARVPRDGPAAGVLAHPRLRRPLPRLLRARAARALRPREGLPGGEDPRPLEGQRVPRHARARRIRLLLRELYDRGLVALTLRGRPRRAPGQPPEHRARHQARPARVVVIEGSAHELAAGV